MKCLSLTQPWASLVAIGAKRIETRDWSVSYRGPLAIHASAGFPHNARLLCATSPFYEVLKTASFDTVRKPEKVLPLGSILAVCDLVDVVQMRHDEFSEVCIASTLSRHLCLDTDQLKTIEGRTRYRQEEAFGDYTPERYMWLLRNVYRLPEPVPAKGSLRLWNTDLEDPRGGAGHVR